jgi:hypothetical protein
LYMRRLAHGQEERGAAMADALGSSVGEESWDVSLSAIWHETLRISGLL